MFVSINHFQGIFVYLKMNIFSYLKNELIRGSLILFILINIGNFINYLFQFSMARMLGPSDYSILAVISSIVYIFMIPTNSIQAVVSKYSTKANVEDKLGKIKYMLGYLIKKNIFIGLIGFMIFTILSIFLSVLLKIDFLVLGLTGFMIFGLLISPVSIGILQGMKRFKIWGWNFIIGSGFKLLIAIILVFIGFGVYGAVIGLISGVFISFFLVFPFIKDVLKAKEKRIYREIKIFQRKDVYDFLIILFIVLIYSIDVILAKGFFSSEIAGEYAVASMIGKIILLSSMAITYAMFPISSEKFVRGDKTKSMIKKTGISLMLICIIAVLFLFFFPKQVILILFGSQYLNSSNIVLYIGIAFSLIALLNFLIFYRVSLDKIKIREVILLASFFGLLVVMLSLFHDTILQFSIVFMISTIIMLLLSILVFRK